MTCDEYVLYPIIFGLKVLLYLVGDFLLVKAKERDHFLNIYGCIQLPIYMILFHQAVVDPEKNILLLIRILTTVSKAYIQKLTFDYPIAIYLQIDEVGAYKIKIFKFTMLYVAMGRRELSRLETCIFKYFVESTLEKRNSTS